MKITKGKPWQNSGELCGMKSTRMPLPGSRIFATYFFNMFKPSNTLLNTTEFPITRKKYFGFLA
jgi:hypothetical protein